MNDLLIKEKRSPLRFIKLLFETLLAIVLFTLPVNDPQIQIPFLLLAGIVSLVVMYDIFFKYTYLSPKTEKQLIIRKNIELMLISFSTLFPIMGTIYILAPIPLMTFTLGLVRLIEILSKKEAR